MVPQILQALPGPAGYQKAADGQDGAEEAQKDHPPQEDTGSTPSVAGFDEESDLFRDALKSGYLSPPKHQT